MDKERIFAAVMEIAEATKGIIRLEMHPDKLILHLNQPYESSTLSYPDCITTYGLPPLIPQDD